MKRRRLYAAVAIVGGLVLAVWAARLRIATSLVDRRLAEAGVSGRYRITRIGPFLERMDDVRIGDPARPDLVAKRIDVRVGYGLTGPFVREIDVDGVRIGARLDDRGLHLGAIDRLLPHSGGKMELPDLNVVLHDVRVALATPNGAIGVALAGTGNPARRFGGTVRVAADRLRLASCSLSRISADMTVAIEAGAPRVEGLARVLGTGCPGLALGAGALRIAATSGKAFDQVRVQARPAGFAGMAGPARFAAVSGAIGAAGALGHLTGEGALTFAHFALPDQAAAVARIAVPVGLPIRPVADRATRGVAQLLRDARGDVAFDGVVDGLGTSVHVRRMMLSGRDGARLSAMGGQGLSWAATGWRIDTYIASGGGDLPPLRVRIRQAGEGAALSGIGRLDPYAMGHASIALPRLSFTWDKGDARFDMLVGIDGPLGDGFVRGLVAPIDGRVTADGGFSIDEGCRDIAFRELRQSSFVFDAARLRMCGRPLAARKAGGAMRIDAMAGPLRLTGKSGALPILVAADHVRMTERGFVTAGVRATIGEPDRLTRMEAVALAGQFDSAGLCGTFAGAGGAIANVPLDLKGAAGNWALRGGALSIKGGLQISDQAAELRVFPLDADDVTLDLAGGRIVAAGILRQPARKTDIARVTLAHDLATGTGHADLDVRGVAFVPKGLQPEALTPLTLGVVANVAGTILGHGRIDWSGSGVTSGGTFGTDRLDLAAAFGPVSGIKGRIVFTDLLGLVSAPAQTATIAELNTGVIVSDGFVHYQLIGDNRVRIEDATFPFAAGMLRLDPATLDFSKARERRLIFRMQAVDAAAFIQQLDFPNISATGTFDGTLPLIFDDTGGRIEKGYIAAQGGGTLAYVGELTTAQLGTMGKLAFDALKAIRYSALDISLDGRLDGEMVSKVRFTGVREATPDQGIVTRLIRNLPFRFNIAIRAPFRQLVGSARAYMDPRLLLNGTVIAPPEATKPIPTPIQPAESGDVR